MSRRLKLIVAYDGRGFAGWQSQYHRNTIQDHLERALEHISGKVVRVHGAGRTDAGVHALAQCAHVDLADSRLSPARWTGALNARLPPRFACFDADMFQRIFMLACPRKEKSIATEFGPL